MAEQTPRECSVCGAFGPWRRAGHAEWCARITAALNARPAPKPPPAEHGTPARYEAGCSCLRCVRAWVDHHRRLLREEAGHVGDVGDVTAVA